MRRGGPDEPDRLQVLIVDDEPPARRRLRRLLEARSEVGSIEEAADAEEAVTVLRLGGVDLLFLDVQMPGGSGLQVLERVGPAVLPPVVFVTAHDEFAVKAFELSTVDYLLKPFDDDRFHLAFDRALRRLASEARDERAARLGELSAAIAPDSRRQHLVVEKAGRSVVLELGEIEALLARGNYVALRARGEEFLVRRTLKELAAALDPAVFQRVHRSVIVNLGRVREIRRTLGSRHQVVLHDGSRVPLSRRWRRLLPRLPPESRSRGD
ncbi:MAG TPA: LytTR family DNA-binding domain-containing protein [Thermoanaerobaculia bacterium]|nr:LytTR family DNA-binding domain-containing protein [Thermoanaerobaculia bacterium]